MNPSPAFNPAERNVLSTLRLELEPSELRTNTSLYRPSRRAADNVIMTQPSMKSPRLMKRATIAKNIYISAASAASVVFSGRPREPRA